MDPSELNLPQSLQPPSLVSEVVCSHHPMENPPQNQQYEKEQLEMEQPELELNLTSGPLPTLSLPPQPKPPLRRLEQNLTPWEYNVIEEEVPLLQLSVTAEQENQGEDFGIHEVEVGEMCLKEQLELEQPELELNLTRGPLPTRSPPLPTSPLGSLEQNLTPWPLPTGSLPPAAMSSPLGPLEQNLTPWALPTRPWPPLPMTQLGPLELNLSTWQQQEIQFVDSAVGGLEQSQVVLGLNMMPSPLLQETQNFEKVGVVGTGEGETELDQLNSGCLGHEKSKENTPGGESTGNNKTIDVDSHPNETPAFDDEEGFPQLNSDPLASDQVAAVTVDINNVIEEEVPLLQLSATAEQENQGEDFGIHEVEVGEMCLKEQLEQEQPELELNLTRGPLPTRSPPLPTSPLGSLEQNLTPWPLPTRPLPSSPLGPLEQNLTPWPLPTRPLPPLPTPLLGPLELNLSTSQQQDIQFDDSAVGCLDLALNLTPSLPQSPRPLPPRPQQPPEPDPIQVTLYMRGLERFMLGDEGEEVGVVGTGEGETELDQLSTGNKKTVGVRIASPLEGVSQTEGMDLNEGFSQLNSDPLASDQVAAVTVDTNNVVVKEIPLLQLSPTENDGMSLKGAAKDPNASAVTIDANSVVAKDIPPPQFSATAQQDNPESGGVAEPQFESRCSIKRKRTEKTPREERRNKKTGVGIGTPSEDSLQTKGVSLKDDAKHLKGVKPTKFKRGARLRQRELKVHDMPSSKKQSKSVKGGTLRNTSRGGLAESNVDVNTVSGQASLKKWSMSFNRKGGIKIDKPCLTEITSENEGEVQAFRSSLRGIMRLIKELNLSTCQKEVLKKTPFWGMFEAIIENKLSPMQCHRRRMMIIEIIKTYDPITRKFRIGRESMELTPADMASIFGISCGNERVSLKYGCKEDVKLVARREDVKLVESWLSSELLKQLLKKYVGSDEKDDVENVARLLCVYLCHTFFFATGPRVKWAYLKLVKDLDRMQDYDWNGAIINELMSSITTYHSEPWKVTGCVTALLYWLCEHTNLFEANHSEHPLGIVKWKIPLVVSRLKEIRLKDLKPRQVVSRQANVAGTTDDEVPVDKDIVQDSVSLGDVTVSKRGNDACLENGKKDEKTPRGERVGRSALKRVRPHYNIHRSSPRDEHNLICHERIPQSNSDPLLPPNQVNDTMKTNSVTVKARYRKETIKFRLSRPWRMVELKQQVKKRLKLKAGTYCIRYKDENDELILIACDEDLQDCISNSSQLGTSSIEVFLESK